jgi:hypothetical protein
MEDTGVQVERRNLQPEQPEGYIELRKHKRYAVDGLAEVLVADGTMLFRGRVLDISEAGCFIETQARLRLLPGTPVEMVFRVNERVFRPMAEARMVKPEEGAGFLFTHTSSRTKQELITLIAELSREVQEM